MAEPPFCRKCGNPHWRFKACAGDPDAPAVRPVEIVRRPRTDGLVEWGDRFTTLRRDGDRSFGLAARSTSVSPTVLRGPDGNVVQLPRLPKPGPRLTPPPEAA